MEPKRSQDLGILIVPRMLLAAVIVVAACHLVDVSITTDWVHENYFRDLFDMGQEANLPTWLASVIWATVCVAAALCFVQLRGQPPLKRIPWLLISIMFGVASLDEIAELHENVGHYFHQAQLATGNPHYLHDGSPGSPWILVYLPFLAAAAIGTIVFMWRNLPRRYFCMVCAGFSCFVVSISCDYYQGMYGPNKRAIADAVHINEKDLVYGSIFVEENLENLGALLIAWAFMGRYENEKRKLKQVEEVEKQAVA